MNGDSTRSKSDVSREEDVASPAPADLLSNLSVRGRFEETSAALEAADLVRRMRKQALSSSGIRGISQNELAQRTGLSQPRISQIEKADGRDGLSYAVLRKIAYACGLDWGQLLRDIVARGMTSPQAGELTNDATAMPSPAVAAPSPGSRAYKGSLVRTGDGIEVGRIADVFFDETGIPGAVIVEGTARVEGRTFSTGYLLKIDNDREHVHWDATKGSFVAPDYLARRPFDSGSSSASEPDARNTVRGTGKEFVKQSHPKSRPDDRLATRR